MRVFIYFFFKCIIDRDETNQAVSGVLIQSEALFEKYDKYFIIS